MDVFEISVYQKMLYTMTPIFLVFMVSGIAGINLISPKRVELAGWASFGFVLVALFFATDILFLGGQYTYHVPKDFLLGR